ncbi:MAG: membrane dipeptidase [Gemmatimonadaceae bacterium]
MNRRHFLHAAAASAVASQLPRVWPAGSRSPLPTESAQGKPSALIMDAMGELRPEYDIALLKDMLGSGLDAITVTLCDPKFDGAEALQEAVNGLLDYDRLISSKPEFFLKANSVADVDRARQSGKLAVFYLYQNTTQFGSDLDRVDMFYRLGLRSCQLTYNDKNLAGAGCRSSGGGLTPFGHQLIEKMNQRRMLLDLSHVHMETMADAIAASKSPAHISHTGCAALHPHLRNTTDANLKALADKGGVTGICQIRPFITDKKRDNLGDYVDHIDHAIKVSGVEHVCIGSDRDHRRIELTPEYIAQLQKEEGPQFTDAELPLFLEALNGPRRMETIWDALRRRGHSEDAVEKIMGRNLYRLYHDVIG